MFTYLISLRHNRHHRICLVIASYTKVAFNFCVDKVQRKCEPSYCDVTTNAPPTKSESRSKFTYNPYTCPYLRWLPTLRHYMNNSLVFCKLYLQRCRADKIHSLRPLDCLYHVDYLEWKKTKKNNSNVTP